MAERYFCVMLFIACLTPRQGYAVGNFTYSHETQKIVVDYLTSKNDYRIPPEDVVKTTANFSIHVNEFDDLRQSLTTNLQMKFMWTDTRLEWNKSAYHAGGVVLPAQNVWRPDLFLLGAVNEATWLNHGEDEVVYVQSDGRARLTGNSVLVSSCEVDVTNFPFDVQECDVVITSVGYSAQNLRFTALTLVESPLTNSIWRILNTSIHSATEESGETSVIMSLTLARRQTVHFGTDFMPPILLMFLGIFCFLIPIESGEKLSFCVSNFLSTVVYVTYTASLCPRTAQSKSLFVIYLAWIMCASVANVVMTAVVVVVGNKPGKVTGMMEKITIKYNKVSDETAIAIWTWRDVSRGVDRIFLVTYAVMAVIPSVVVITKICVG